MDPRKRISLLLATTIVASLLVVIATTLGRARDSSPTNPRVKVLRRKDQLHIKPRAEEIAAFQEGQRERTFKTREFKDMPLAIREARNLNSETWYKDLEIEVRNVSTKPIYFIFGYLEFPDVPVTGNGVSGIHLEFGDRKNGDMRRIADPQDPHVDPGETVVLTIPEQYRKGLKVKHERIPQNMKKFELHFAVITFGDGTAFEREHLRDYRLKKSHFDAKKNHHSNRLGSSTAVRAPPQDGCGPCSRYFIDSAHPFQICYGRRTIKETATLATAHSPPSHPISHVLA